jgi:hypothetical protein
LRLACCERLAELAAKGLDRYGRLCRSGFCEEPGEFL